MPDYRETRWWDKQLEGQLPDCRVRYTDREKKTVVRGRMRMDVVFCAQCGTESGLVPVHCPHVYFICDPCFWKSEGITPPGSVMVG